MCSAPVSTSTERSPMIGRIGELPVADGATPGGAVNSALTASGSLISTIFMPLGVNVNVNASPIRRAQLSITHVGASAHASVCKNAGARGPGGNPAREPPPVASARRPIAVRRSVRLLRQLLQSRSAVRWPSSQASAPTRESRARLASSAKLSAAAAGARAPGARRAPARRAPPRAARARLRRRCATAS